MASYAKSPNDKGGWTVQVRHDTGGIANIQHFRTEAEAQAWIAAHKAHEEAAAKRQADER